MVSIGAMELQTAKETLAEVFGARPGEVEKMIKSRLEEERDSGEHRAGEARRWAVARDVLPE